MKKTFEYRAYPTFKQAQTLTVWLEVLRNLYNQALAWRKEAYQETGESISWVTQANALPELRQEMVQNHYLSKSISDAGWGRFRLILQSKAANAGLTLTKVNPKHTSQKCSGCDSIVPKSLSVRTHDCPHCGLVIDRAQCCHKHQKGCCSLAWRCGGNQHPRTPRKG